MNYFTSNTETSDIALTAEMIREEAAKPFPKQAPFVVVLGAEQAKAWLAAANIQYRHEYPPLDDE